VLEFSIARKQYLTREEDKDVMARDLRTEPMGKMDSGGGLGIVELDVSIGDSERFRSSAE
jgi:hypothetical protein